ncbi:hypothetical protein WQE_05057 [Paraburkholderia hospita]|uniref:Uncharacterized protein n=1 Tax=Paraburkholderia hospita TaxID=169430 RepID=A0ABN0FTN3_9BURK|nr:hypothetical protein [Paraburkholderia hospita]EIN02176.1 hypothetical protein WQE_05057 [Paraburkholderia hospita]OUL90137.1 hypothetical protein CA602_07200 [Paraburkholderia hospita]
MKSRCLAQNAVLPLRHDVRGGALKAPMLESLVSTGMPILANDLSLRQRGIAADIWDVGRIDTS